MLNNFWYFFVEILIVYLWLMLVIMLCFFFMGVNKGGINLWLKKNSGMKCYMISLGSILW